MPNNVHDAFFKATFSQVEHAASELKLVLPPELAARIDFTTLALCPGSFVDEALAERHTDLLFSAQIAGRTGHLYVLFEHQSSFDPLMPFRLLRYMVRVWEAHLKEHPQAKRLPVILPVVLHHSETGWRAEPTFEGLLDIDTDFAADIAEYVPRFRFLLDDLSAETDEALKERAMSALGRLALWCLRNARTPEQLVEGIKGWMDLVREVRRAPNGAAALAPIWRYIFAANERLRAEDIVGLLVQKVGEEDKEEIVNAAEQLREEGRREGLLEGRRTLLLKLLGARFGGLSNAATARVNSADSTELDVWAERVLTAGTLAEVLGDVRAQGTRSR